MSAQAGMSSYRSPRENGSGKITVLTNEVPQLWGSHLHGFNYQSETGGNPDSAGHQQAHAGEEVMLKACVIRNMAQVGHVFRR